MNRSRNYIKCFSLASFVGLVIAAWCCKLIAYPDFKQAPKQDSFKSSANSTILQTTNNIRPLDELAQSNNDLRSNYGTLNTIDLDPKVLKLALTAYQEAKNLGINYKKEILTVVDYSMPSTKRRMWVIDLNTNKVLYHTHVAHGSGSGQNYATRFSNRPGSAMSSLGMFVTGDIYQGRYGYALNLHGIDGKFNSNAYSRRIVLHGAHYVNDNVIHQIGRLGRSLGCLALNKKVAHSVMHAIKDGSFVFCYYPDKDWLNQSQYLAHATQLAKLSHNRRSIKNN